MTHNIPQAAEAQRMCELETLEQFIGVGAPANYLISDVINLKEVPLIDKSEISGPPMASTEANAAMQASSAESTEEEQYVDNSDEYNENVNGSGDDNGDDNLGTIRSALTADDSAGADAPAEGYGSGRSGAINGVNAVEQGLDEQALGFSDDNALQQNENGYWEPDEEELERWAMYMLSRANILNALFIAIFSQFEAKQIADEIFSGVPADRSDSKYSAKKIVARKIQSILKIMQTGITKVGEVANSRNQKIYEEKMAEINERVDDKGDRCLNLMTLGERARDAQLDALNETQRYLATTAKTLLAMQAVTKALIEFIQDTAGNGDGALQALGTIKNLTKLSRKLEELNQEVEKQIAEVQEQIDELEDSGFFESLGNIHKGFFKFIGGIFEGLGDGLINGDWEFDLLRDGLGDFLEGFKDVVVMSLVFLFDFIDLALKGLGWLLGGFAYDSKYSPLSRLGDVFGSAADSLNYYGHRFDLDDGFDGGDWTNPDLGPGLGAILRERWTGEAAEEGGTFDYQIVDIEQFIQEYRGGIVGAQNAYRMYLSLKLFKTDLRNTTREVFTGISGPGTNAELLMLSTEGMFGNVLRVFDKATSQLMLKVRLNNQMVNLAKGLEQINRSQLFMVVGMLAMIVAVVCSILSFIFPPAAGVAVGGYALAAFIAGMVSSIAMSMGAYLSSLVDTPDAIEPYYNSSSHTTFGNGGVVLDGLNRIEQEQEGYLRAAARNQGMFITTEDEMLTFNSTAFAAYEARLNMMNNAVRMIFSLIKNARDMRRVALAEFTGVSPQDSGEALLQNAVNNILAQRQVMLSAIKFQIQELITARNFARQNELRAGVAAGGGLAAVAGAVVGLLVSIFIPGGAAITMACVGIGGALGSAAYNFIMAGWGPGNMLDADLVDSTRELEKVLKDHGGRSVEDRLDRAEQQVYQELLANGIADAGDGYYAVDVGVVSRAYSRIMAIYTVKEMLARMRAMASELRALVKQQMGGVSPATAGDLSLSIQQANFSNAMRIASSIVSFLQARVSVLNQARDAEKNWFMQKILFPINVVLAAAGYTGMATNTLPLLSQSAASIMNLANAIGALFRSISEYNSSLGKYENYNARTTVDQAGKKVQNAQTIDDQIDQAEYEEMVRLNNELIVNVDGSTLGVGTAAASSSVRIRQLYNIRIALAIVRSIQVEARRAAGAKISSLDYGRDFMEQYQQAALRLVDSLKQALETVAERQSQKEEALKGIWTASISIALSLASIGMAVWASFEGDAADKAGKAADAATKAGDIKTADAKTNLANLHAKEARTLNRWEAAFGFTSTLLTSTIDYTWQSGEKEDNDKKKAEGKGKLSQKRSALQAERRGNTFNSFDQMDAEANSLEVDMARIENQKRAAVLSTARSEAFVMATFTMMKELAQVFARTNKTLPGKDSSNAAQRAKEEARLNLETKREEKEKAEGKVNDRCDAMVFTRPALTVARATTAPMSLGLQLDPAIVEAGQAIQCRVAVHEYVEAVDAEAKAEQEYNAIIVEEPKSEAAAIGWPVTGETIPQAEFAQTLAVEGAKTRDDAIATIMKEFEGKDAGVCATLAKKVVAEATAGLPPEAVQAVAQAVVLKLAEADPSKAAKVAAALGVTFAQPPAKPLDPFKPQEVTSPATSALVEYADEKIKEAMQQLQSLAQDVEQSTAAAEIGKAEGEIKALEKELKAKPATPNKEQIKARIAELKQKIAEKQAELKKLVEQYRELEAKVKALPAEINTRVQNTQAEIEAHRARIQELSPKVEELAAKEKAGTITPEEQVQLDGMRKEIKARQTYIDMGEKAIPMTQDRAEEAKKLLEAVKGQIQAKQGEIVEINRQVNQLVARKEERRPAERIESGRERRASNETAVASASTAPVEQTDPDGRRRHQRGWLESFRDQHDRVVAEEGGLVASSFKGVSC